MDSDISVIELPEMTIAQKIGANLKRLRQARGVSRKQLAELLKSSVDAIWLYENGKALPPVDKILKMADFFDVSITDLVGDNPNYENREHRFFFKAYLQRLINLLNFDPFLYQVEMLSDGTVTISIPAEIRNNNTGIRSVYHGYNVVKFGNAKDFVEVIERAIRRTIADNVTFNEALRRIIFK